MDEVELMRAARPKAPPYPDAARAAARAALLSPAVRGHIQEDLRNAGKASRRLPKRRLMLVATSMVAAATAATVVIGTAGHGGSGGGSSIPANAALSGRQVLLAAATTAERAPEGSGTYWYVKEASGGTGRKPEETWTRRDGQKWIRGVSTGGTVSKFDGPGAFRLGDPTVVFHPADPHRVMTFTSATYEQLQTLPTAPDALKGWLTNRVRAAVSGIKTNEEPPDIGQTVFDQLISLVATVPAPPKVRAAAFRALASYPNVKSLGISNGEHALSMPFHQGGTLKLVIDSRARVRETTFVTAGIGARTPGPHTTMIFAGWTNTLPQ